MSSTFFEFIWFTRTDSSSCGISKSNPTIFAFLFEAVLLLYDIYFILPFKLFWVTRLDEGFNYVVPIFALIKRSWVRVEISSYGLGGVMFSFRDVFMTGERLSRRFEVDCSYFLSVCSAILLLMFCYLIGGDNIF